MNKTETFIKIKRFLEQKINELQQEIIELEEKHEMLTSGKAIEITDLESNQTYQLNLESPDTSFNLLKKLSQKHQDKKNKKVLDKYLTETKKDLARARKALKSLREVSDPIKNNSIYLTGDIEDFMLDIILIGSSIEITVEDLKTVLIECIRKNYEKYFNNNVEKQKVIESEDVIIITEMESCLFLGKYFDRKGNMIPNENEKEFVAALEKLFSSRSFLNKQIINCLVKENLITINTIIESLLADLRKINQEEKIKMEQKQASLNAAQIEQDISHQKMKEQRIAFKSQKDALKQLSQYYKDSKFIKIPENIEEFKQLLKKCLLPPEQEAKILRYLNNQLAETQENEELSLLKKYLTPTEIAIFSYASNTKAQELSYFISEVNELISLLKNTTDEEEINILVEYIKDNIKNIQYSLTPEELTAKKIFV